MEDVQALDGRRYPASEVAEDADRTPVDPELVAGEFTPDPWESDPQRWSGTDPVLRDRVMDDVSLVTTLAATWRLTPALVALRASFNRVAPGRDKASDGSIGDAAHRGSSSDHNPDETGNVPIRDADNVNEVHAIDVDENLRARDVRGAYTMMRAVRQLVADSRDGRENRLRYIIYERTIWSESWSWAARRYTGANPHDKHAHFSGSYVTARERDTRPWNIGWVEDTMTRDEFIAAFRAALADDTVRRQLRAIPLQYPVTPEKSLLTVHRETHDAAVEAAEEQAQVEPAALKAVLLDPEVLAAIAAAVNEGRQDG